MLKNNAGNQSGRYIDLDSREHQKCSEGRLHFVRTENCLAEPVNSVISDAGTSGYMRRVVYNRDPAFSQAESPNDCGQPGQRPLTNRMVDALDAS